MSTKPPTPKQPFQPNPPTPEFYSVLYQIERSLEQIASNQQTNHRMAQQQFEALQKTLEAVAQSVSGQSSALEGIETAITQISNTFSTLSSEDAVGFSDVMSLLGSIQTAVNSLVTPPHNPAVSFEIEVTDAQSQGDFMKSKAVKTGKLKISILDNGTALATITGIVDAGGLPTTFEAGSTAVWVCEVTPGAGQDPSIVLTPQTDANGLPTGCGIAPSVPPALVSGDTLTCTVTQPTTGPMTPQTYNPVNVVAGPANTFVITVQ